MAELDKMSMEDRELWAIEARAGRLQAAIQSSHETAAGLRDKLRHWDQTFLRRIGWAWSQWAELVARSKREVEAKLQRPRSLMRAGLAAFQRCHWRAQPQQRRMLSFVWTCSRPYLAKSLQSWRWWAAERRSSRTYQEKMVRRLLNQRVASVFDSWVELLEAQRRRLQVARGVVQRMQERGMSRSWVRWRIYVRQMQDLQAIMETWVMRSRHLAVRAVFQSEFSSKLLPSLASPFSLVNYGCGQA